MGTSNRFNSLDIARGIAALIVVLSHWGHFLPKGTDFSLFPLSGALTPFYKWGWLAVDFFFVLSGFIFFQLYANSIESRRTSARTFFSNRFTRLYPLHLLTLLAVLALQNVYTNLYHDWYVYKTNDLKSFLLHLFFASQWGIYRAAGDSFNGPVWSVSIEILLYISFFAVCTFRLNRLPHTLALVLIGLVSFWFMSRLGRGLMSFYIGGLVFFAIQKNKHRFDSHPYILLAGCLSIWAFYFYTISIHEMIPSFFGIGEHQAKKFSDSVIVYIGSTLAFPALAITLIVHDARISSLLNRVEFLGNISYSSYLIHFPLQLSIAIFLPPISANTYIYSSPIFLAVFMGGLVILSHLTFVYFERPIQLKLRNLSIFSEQGIRK